jgi:hypothetical protein
MADLVQSAWEKDAVLSPFLVAADWPSPQSAACARGSGEPGTFDKNRCRLESARSHAVVEGGELDPHKDGWAAARATIARSGVAYESGRGALAWQRTACIVWHRAARASKCRRSSWAQAERAALSRMRMRVCAAWRSWRVRLPALRARRREVALARWAYMSRSLRRALACWLRVAWQRLRSADAAAAAARRWGCDARRGTALAMRTWQSAVGDRMHSSRRRSAARAAHLRRAMAAWHVAGRCRRACGAQEAIGARAWQRVRAEQVLGRIRLAALEEARVASRAAFASARGAAAWNDECLSRMGSAWLAWRCAARESRFAATSLLLARRKGASRAVRAWARTAGLQLFSGALDGRAAQHAAHNAAAAAFDALAAAFDRLRAARALANVLLAARRVRTAAVRENRLTRGWVVWAALASASAVKAALSQRRWQLRQRRAALQRWCEWGVARGAAAERARRAAAMLCTSLLMDVRARLGRLRRQPSRLHLGEAPIPPAHGAERIAVGSPPLSACSPCSQWPALHSEDPPRLPQPASMSAASALDAYPVSSPLASHTARTSFSQHHSLERCGTAGDSTVHLDVNFRQTPSRGILAILFGPTTASSAQREQGFGGGGDRDEAALVLYRNWMLVLVRAAKAASTGPARAVARDATTLRDCTRLRRLHTQLSVLDTLRRAGCFPRPRAGADVVRMACCRRALLRWAKTSRFDRSVSQFLAAAAAAGAENATPQAHRPHRSALVMRVR